MEAARTSCSGVSFKPRVRKLQMDRRACETEPRSAAPSTPEKISRGLHPTSTTTAGGREWKEVSLRTFSFFSALWKTSKQNETARRGNINSV